MRKKNLTKKFKIESALITLRFGSRTVTTATFDPKVEDYMLQVAVPLEKFESNFLYNPTAAQVVFEVKDVLYIARVGSSYMAEITPEIASLIVELVNIQPKEAYDLEHLTPRVFYNQLLRDRKFFFRSGRGLDSLISPLGLSRKKKESDQSFRRRVIEYLQFKIGEQFLTDEDLIRLTKLDRS